MLTIVYMTINFFLKTSNQQSSRSIEGLVTGMPQILHAFFWWS